MDVKELINRFGYHPADTKAKRDGHAEIRSNFLAHALMFNVLLPDGREKAMLMTNLEESCRVANAAWALANGPARVDELDDQLLELLHEALTCLDGSEYVPPSRQDMIDAINAELSA